MEMTQKMLDCEHIIIICVFFNIIFKATWCRIWPFVKSGALNCLSATLLSLIQTNITQYVITMWCVEVKLKPQKLNGIQVLFILFCVSTGSRMLTDPPNLHTIINRTHVDLEGVSNVSHLDNKPINKHAPISPSEIKCQRCKGASGVKGFQNNHSFLTRIQFNKKKMYFCHDCRGGWGAEQPREQRLLSSSAFCSPGSWAGILRGASQTLGTERGRVL